jgi:hypothetical protein
MVRPNHIVLAQFIQILCLCLWKHRLFWRFVGEYEGVRTRGQTLLELLGLVGVLKDKGVDVL